LRSYAAVQDHPFRTITLLRLIRQLLLNLLALPREAHHSGDFNGLAGSLGKNPPIELQSVSTVHPKPSQTSFPIVIAEWERNSDDVLKPGKTGITLALKHLPALADAMGKALAAARDLGLIEGPGNGHGR
jgi:hypothetical protein